MTPQVEPEIHPKGWGFEKWIVNNQNYCGKILYFDENKRCSFHYHKLKTETFHLQAGKMLIIYSFDDDLESADEILLNPGDSFHVPIGLRHQMVAIEKSELYEFSTQHLEEDSYRIVRGD